MAPTEGTDVDLRDQDGRFCPYANPAAMAVMGPQGDRQLQAAVPQERTFRLRGHRLDHGPSLPSAKLLRAISVDMSQAPVNAPWTSARSSLRTGMALEGSSCVKRMTTRSSTGLTQKKVPAAPPQP